MKGKFFRKKNKFSVRIEKTNSNKVKWLEKFKRFVSFWTSI